MNIFNDRLSGYNTWPLCPPMTKKVTNYKFHLHEDPSIISKDFMAQVREGA